MLSYVEKGEGPAALFVHGVFLNSRLWRDVVDGVADLRRCIAVDLPAHGRTPASEASDLSLGGLADALESFCADMGLDQVDLVGNDTGGAVCQIFAGRHPERIRTLTLTNCDTVGNLPPANFVQAVELAKAGQLTPVVQQLATDPELARTPVGLGATFERPEDLSDEHIREYLSPFATEEGARGLEQVIAAMDEADLAAVEPALKALDVPALIVWGTGDTFFEPSWAEYLKGLLPGAQDVVYVDGGRLFFPDERPHELVAPLRRFWS